MSCECGENESCKCNNGNDLIPDKHAYQSNKRRMAWVLIILMGITTIILQDDLKELTKAYYTVLKENEKLKRTH